MPFLHFREHDWWNMADCQFHTQGKKQTNLLLSRDFDNSFRRICRYVKPLAKAQFETWLGHPMPKHRKNHMKKLYSLYMTFVKDNPDPGNINFTSCRGRFPDFPRRVAFPSVHERTVAKEWMTLHYWGDYSSGHCSGFTPDSLLWFPCLHNERESSPQRKQK